MSRTDYRKLLDKDYLGAWDIPENSDLILTIKSVGKEEVMNASRKKEDVMVLHFTDAKKPMICNVTNAKSISKVAGSTYIEDWVGVRIALYSAEVSAFGDTCDAIRVREVAPKLPDKLVCAMCGKEVVGTNGYSASSIAEQTRGQYGKILCWECAKKAKADADKKAKESDVL